jgi:AAA+ ATPase superfamily predicted ATPase
MDPSIQARRSSLATLMKQLPQNYVVFYVNLRGKFITDYKDFVRALFKIEKGKEEKEILKKVSEVSVKALKFMGIPVTEDVVDFIFKEKTYEDVFEFIEDYFAEIAKNKEPVLIVDELQVIGDVKIDELLIYKLFNFFVRLTKELHLCHVFAVSSDSLFIEEIYRDAMLQGRCDYLLVDDFDYEETKGFLEKYGFSDDANRKVWEYCGGKPVYLLKVINAKISGKDVKEEVERMLEIRKSQILSIFDAIALKEVDISEDAITKEFGVFETADEMEYERLSDEKIFLVKKNVFFVDPTRRRIRPQSKLDLLAIRKVIGQ